MAKKKSVKTDKKAVNNSLTSLVDSVSGNLYGFGGSSYFGGGAPVSSQKTLMHNTNYDLVFWNRALLNEMYIKHGIVQTLIDQPVDDALRGGVKIKCASVDVSELERFIDKNDILQDIGQALKWARLFGGGAVVVLTDQKADTPLDVKRINSGSYVRFYAADLWELTGDTPTSNVSSVDGADGRDFCYEFYGKRIHASRVFKIKGKEAPSLMRPRMRGWGMTEVERLIRSINSYFKNQEVIFELLDEAKVDVYGITDFNSALLTDGGTEAVTRRIQLANMLKNFQSALVMDKDDSHEQKQMNFGGLSDLLPQIRQGVAADLKMPVTKLFGVSAAGFNSGEDDIENYNSMIEGEIRSKVKWIILEVFGICCQKVFGFVPDDLEIEFPPLRVLSAKEVEEVKDRKADRVIRMVDAGLITAEEAKRSINEDNLLPIEIDESDELTDTRSREVGESESKSGGFMDKLFGR